MVIRCHKFWWQHVLNIQIFENLILAHGEQKAFTGEIRIKIDVRIEPAAQADAVKSWVSAGQLLLCIADVVGNFEHQKICKCIDCIVGVYIL